MSLQLCKRSRRGFGGGLWLVAVVASLLPPSSAAPVFAFSQRLVRGAPHCGSPHPSGSARPQATERLLAFFAVSMVRVFFLKSS